DTTYFGTLFLHSVNGSSSPVRPGHAPALTLHVRAPWRMASVCSMAPPMKPPMISGSKNGPDHPPCWNPPSVSSSAPPGACTMPSRLMNSLITIRMQVGRCHESKLIAEILDHAARVTPLGPRSSFQPPSCTAT